jgi:hypothetical protein
LAILAILWAAPVLFHAVAGPKTFYLLSLALGFRPLRGLSFSHQGASALVGVGSGDGTEDAPAAFRRRRRQ